MFDTRSTVHTCAPSAHLNRFFKKWFGPWLAVAVLSAGCGAHQGEHHEAHEHGRYPATSPLLTDTTVARDYVCQIRSGP